MSDNILKLIPIKATFMPTEKMLKELTDVLDKYFSSLDFNILVTDNIRFIDQGANWKRVTCPICNSVIDDSWWQVEMDKAYANNFTDLEIVSPCCGSKISLNDLYYEWPAGFARFSIEIRNPNENVDAEILGELENIIGTTLKKIWAHY